MNLFGRKSARATVPLSRPYAAWLSGGLGGGAAQVPLPYEGQVREAYLANPVAQRCVRLVAEAVASAPLDCDIPELSALVRATSAGQGLLETAAAQLLLHGNAYIQVIAGVDGDVAELFALRPERVAVEASASGWPVAYLYRVGARTVRLASEDGAGRTAVIHAKLMHPLDDHYGAGALSAAAGAVAAHNAAARWNRNLLDNAARPTGCLVYDPGEPGATLTEAQFERLRAEMEANYQGAANAGRPMLLEGGLKWQAMGLTPADMDFVRLKDAAAREVAMAFGVPPMLIGIPGDATYANYREASRALWRLTVLPLAEKLLGAVRQGLKDWYPGARLCVDLNQVPALAEDREALWTQVNAANFLSDDEKRRLLGLGEVAD
jgi:HK97 family phage portal protein